MERGKEAGMGGGAQREELAGMCAKTQPTQWSALDKDSP